MRQLYAQRSGDQLTFIELAVLSRLHRDGPGSASRLANGERVTAQAVGAASRAHRGVHPGPVSSTFILRRDADRPRVVFYLNHQDLTRAFRPS
jgi:hypothetical protein